MKKLKRFLEFAQNCVVDVLSVNDIPLNRLNRSISKGMIDFDSDDFLVNLYCNGSEKLVSIPHGLFLDYIKNNDKNLSNYIDKLSSLEDVFTELKELGWDFQKAIQDFVNKEYDSEKFLSLPDINEDDADDIGGWTDEDQQAYDDLIDDI